MNRKSSRHRPRRGRNGAPAPQAYEEICRLAVAGCCDDARREFEALRKRSQDPRLLALLENDLAALAILAGKEAEASDGFARALEIDASCQLARRNRDLLLNCRAAGDPPLGQQDQPPAAGRATAVRTRIAVLSFLFNWPSQGGGIIHTVELVEFLRRAGYDARHFFAQQRESGVGCVEGHPPIASEAIPFLPSEWSAPVIQSRFRAAVDRFAPDFVLITDAWNMKPVLAEAMQGYRYFLRQQALEMLCPLNNLRLLPAAAGGVCQCPLNQLDHAAGCRRCVDERQQLSGSLHQAERRLSGFGTPSYDATLRRVLRGAEAVLVHNPDLARLYEPHARDVQVVTWGMDPARFPWPWSPEPRRLVPPGITAVVMAGVVNEFIKGFHVLHEACARLWQRRQDFRLFATGEPTGAIDEFTHYLGWISQNELPAVIRGADVLAVPTVAQDGLSRTSVEAMGVGRPVLASRIGGLPYTVAHESTGLLFEPGNVSDLISQLERLLDDPPLRERMGLAGRRRFEADFTWPAVIERQYGPLFARREVRPAP